MIRIHKECETTEPHSELQIGPWEVWQYEPQKGLQHLTTSYPWKLNLFLDVFVVYQYLIIRGPRRWPWVIQDRKLYKYEATYTHIYIIYLLIHNHPGVDRIRTFQNILKKREYVGHIHILPTRTDHYMDQQFQIYFRHRAYMKKNPMKSRRNPMKSHRNRMKLHRNLLKPHRNPTKFHRKRIKPKNFHRHPIEIAQKSP